MGIELGSDVDIDADIDCCCLCYDRPFSSPYFASVSAAAAATTAKLSRSTRSTPDSA